MLRPITIPGVFVEVLGAGVLITGESGIGKSELALELISRGARLVVDDAPEFSSAGGLRVEGSCPEGLGDFLAHRDLGVVNIRALFGAGAVTPRAGLDLIVDLRRPAPAPGVGEPPPLELGYESRDVLGMSIPAVRLSTSPGRTLAVVVETLVRAHRLRVRGYDAFDDFQRRQAALMGLAEGELTGGAGG
jgi:HPr kinase/phosphorylase